jgi:hypothetical protein
MLKIAKIYHKSLDYYGEDDSNIFAKGLTRKNVKVFPSKINKRQKLELIKCQPVSVKK